jgi:hypothetical protein
MAPKISTEKMFRRRQKIVAAVDLPGVPAGTFGKVWFVSGVTWIRYHVAFDNGVDEIVEDLQLPSSADSMPGSNSGPIYQVGQTDDDLRVDVTGDLTLIVEGYTIVP